MADDDDEYDEDNDQELEAYIVAQEALPPEQRDRLTPEEQREVDAAIREIVDEWKREDRVNFKAVAKRVLAIEAEERAHKAAATARRKGKRAAAPKKRPGGR
jgi:hypothetical protein